MTETPFQQPPAPASSALFDRSRPDLTERPLTDAEGNPDFGLIREHSTFSQIRRRLNRFVFVATVLFFCWYMTYVLLAAYAPGLMAHRLTGSVTVGLLLGLCQFVTTVVIMLAYARFARRKIDGPVAELRSRTGAGQS